MLQALARVRLALFAAILTVIQMVILVPVMSRLGSEKPLRPVYQRADIEAGRAQFQEHCAACHGGEAKGEPAMMKSMAGLDISAAAHKSPDFISHVIRQGKGAMPPFAGLTEDEVREIIVYLRSLPE